VIAPAPQVVAHCVKTINETTGLALLAIEGDPLGTQMDAANVGDTGTVFAALVTALAKLHGRDRVTEAAKDLGVDLRHYFAEVTQ
jgi:hypothetical protein